LAILDQGLAKALKQVAQEHEEKLRQIAQSSAEKEAQLKAEYQTNWQVVESEWKQRIYPIVSDLKASAAEADALFPPWGAVVTSNWSPPERLPSAAKFARMAADLERLSGGLPADKRLALPDGPRLDLALCLTYPNEGSILFETADTGRDQAML